MFKNLKERWKILTPVASTRSFSACLCTSPPEDECVLRTMQNALSATGASIEMDMQNLSLCNCALRTNLLAYAAETARIHHHCRHEAIGLGFLGRFGMHAAVFFSSGNSRKQTKGKGEQTEQPASHFSAST